MGTIYEDNSASIGHTPLVRLNRITRGLDSTIAVKIEGRNPAYSVKCRIGAAMIWAAERDGKLKPVLQQRAEREKLDNVVFHDPVNKSRLAGLMASTDVGLQVLANVPAFYFGTSPNKFFDYIAAGLPVLNNYPGWLAGMIRDSRCGFAVPPDNPSAFADALEQAAADRMVLKTMGQRGRALAEREFDRSQLANRWVDAVENTWLSRTKSMNQSQAS